MSRGGWKMKELLEKITSYNLFNYLLPGVIFSLLVSKMTRYPIIQQDLVVGFFLYYFIGMVISRFGSIVIEPLLKKISLIEFTNYNDYVMASKKDLKIELFSEINNTYRTILSLLILLIFLKIYETLEINFNFPQAFTVMLTIVLLVVLFLLSYRKQTSYIKKRITSNQQQ